jgi:hypothetical protein
MSLDGRRISGDQAAAVRALERTMSELEGFLGNETEVETEVKTENTGDKPETPPASATPAEQPAKPHPNESQTIPISALLDERGKRQNTERELEDYKAKLLAYEEKQAKKPDLFEDPDGWQKSIHDSAEKRVKEAEDKLTVRFLGLSEQLARSRYPDYNEKLDAFGKILQQEPSLHARMMSAADPAEYVYRTAKQYMELQGFESVEKLREKIREEERAKLLAENGKTVPDKTEAEETQKPEVKPDQPKAPAIPDSLSNERSAGDSPPTHQSLKDIFGR